MKVITTARITPTFKSHDGEGKMKLSSGIKMLRYPGDMRLGRRPLTRCVTSWQLSRTHGGQDVAERWATIFALTPFCGVQQQALKVRII